MKEIDTLKPTLKLEPYVEPIKHKLKSPGVSVTVYHEAYCITDYIHYSQLEDAIIADMDRVFAESIDRLLMETMGIVKSVDVAN